MQTSELEQEIKQNSISGIYLIFGDETYDVERYKDKIVKNFLEPTLGINYFVLDKTSLDSLKDLCEEVSFFGTKKIIEIRDTNLKFNLEYILNFDSKDVLIIIVESSIDKRTKEYKELVKKAKVIECTKLKEKDAMFFVKQTLNAYKLQISDELLDYVISSCTTDKLTLINEMKKLVAYATPNSTLTKDIIDNVLTKTLDAKVFDMLDILFTGDKEKTIKEFNELIEQKTYIGIISITIFKQIKQLYMIKLLNEKSTKEKITYDVAKELNIHPFVCGKLKAIEKKYTKEKLKQILLEFANYDRNIKLGTIDAEIGLKNILMMI